MDEAFAQIKTMLVRNQVMWTKVRSVMMIPAVTMIVLILVLAFMMTVVVPKFQVMFGATGTALPIPTQMLVPISEMIRSHPLLSVIGGAAAIFGLARFPAIFKKFPALHAIAKAIISVSKGEKIAEALQPIKTIFGPEILHQIAFGEEAGSIPSLLKTLTKRQDCELVAFIDDMKPVLEATLIAVMGGLVGAIVVALYLPIFNIGQTLIGR